MSKPFYIHYDTGAWSPINGPNHLEASFNLEPELKAAWLKALREGKYQQARQRLRCGNGFCCLGVLCDLLYPAAWDQDELVLVGVRYDKFAPVALLPKQLQRALAKMNDSGMSFEQIADWLEEYL